MTHASVVLGSTNGALGTNAISDTNPLPVAIVESVADAPNINTNAVTISTTATLIVDVNTSRSSLSVYNNGSADIYVGNSGVTTANGMPIPSKSERLIEARAALYGVVASGTVEVRYMEETR